MQFYGNFQLFATRSRQKSYRFFRHVFRRVRVQNRLDLYINEFLADNDNGLSLLADKLGTCLRHKFSHIACSYQENR